MITQDENATITNDEEDTRDMPWGYHMCKKERKIRPRSQPNQIQINSKPKKEKEKVTQ
jgi:hypothetical protein